MLLPDGLAGQQSLAEPECADGGRLAAPRLPLDGEQSRDVT
jgi:hypothetical protein